MIHYPRSTKKGLTLIELLISALLISAMLGAIWIIFHTGYTVFYGQYSRQNIKSQASYAFYTMTNELHQAFSVTAATATGITFTMDSDNNGINETVQYTWPGTSGQPLNRVVGAQTMQLVRSISNLSFTYYGTNNTLLSFPVTASQVRLVSIDLTTASGSESFHLRTKVQLRCI
jgi:Tfp pilus assembly protein PilV